MPSKNFNLIFGGIFGVGILVIILFAVKIISPTQGSKLSQEDNKTDALVTRAPGVEKTSRIPSLERKDPVTGNPDGEITIIEFADFECQFCADVQKTIKQVLDAYPSKIRLVWKNYPLSFHALSKKTAEAVLCANEQGKFEAMRDLLFSKQDVSLLESSIRQYAKDAGLDSQKFTACFDGGLNADAVNRDIASAQQFGVDGVPHFFFYKTADPDTGYSMAWAGNLIEFRAVIDTLLQ